MTENAEPKEIESHACTLNQFLFARDDCFYIDFYQREYKWNDKQRDSNEPVISLLNDIWDRFQQGDTDFRDMDISDSVGLKKKIMEFPWYYISTMIITRGGGKDNKTYIVDGQQRLTTLALLLIALKNHPQCDTTTRDLLSALLTVNGEGHIMTMGSQDRKEILESLYAGTKTKDYLKEHPAETCSISVQNIIAAYDTCVAFLKTRLDSTIFHKGFVVYLRERVQLTSIEMANSDDVAMTFEALNDRGSKLKSHEILKGKLLGVLPRGEAEKESRNWSESIEPLMHFGKKNEDLTDDFFLALFRGRYAEGAEDGRKGLTKDNYHQQIYKGSFAKKIGIDFTISKKDRNKNIRKLINEEIPFYASLFCKIAEVTQGKTMPDESWRRYAWLNSLNKSIMLTNQAQVVFSAVSRTDTREIKENKMLIALRKLEMLRVMLHLSNNYYSSDFAPACNRLAASIRKLEEPYEIDDLANTCDCFINNEVQGENAFSGSVYDYINWSSLTYNPSRGNLFIKYFFSRIDNFISEKAEQGSLNNFKERVSKMWQVEHILAYDDDGKNIKKFKTKDNTLEEAKEEFELARNQYGALGMLLQPANGSSNNDLYEEKLGAYGSCGSMWLESLTSDFYKNNPPFKEFNGANKIGFKHIKNFNGESIQQRLQILEKLAPLIWESGTVAETKVSSDTSATNESNESFELDA